MNGCTSIQMWSGENFWLTSGKT